LHPAASRLFAAAALLLLGLHTAVCGSLEFEQDSSASGYVPTTSPSLRFTVATYNVRARPLLDDAGTKFTAIAPILDRFDIVALQECFTDHRLLWERTTFPVRVYDGSRTTWYRLVSSGLSVMARFRARTVEVEKFRDPEGLRYLFRAKKDGLASKGILFARFEMGEGRFLDFYNVHMEAGSDEASNEARRLQTRQLISYVRSTSPPENAVLLVGDFNMRAKVQRGVRHKACSVDLRGLDRHELLDAITRQLNLANSGNLAGPAPTEQIDHIFYRPGSNLRLRPVAWRVDKALFQSKAGVPWSDHDPVIATFVAD